MTTMSQSRLEKEIRQVFPAMAMPAHADLLNEGADPRRHSDVLDDLEAMRSEGVNGNSIRAIHQELALLSAKTWRWLLPHYLLFCLTSEAIYNRFETEFLIYNLGPELAFQRDTQRRLACLNREQIRCLIHFLEWCEGDKYWRDSLFTHIEKAKSFLSIVESELK